MKTNKIFTIANIPEWSSYTASSQKGTKREEEDIQNYYLIFGERWGGRQNQILRAAGQCTRGFGSDLVPVPQVIIWIKCYNKAQKRITHVLSQSSPGMEVGGNSLYPRDWILAISILSPYLWLKPILFFPARPTRSLLEAWYFGIMFILSCWSLG